MAQHGAKVAMQWRYVSSDSEGRLVVANDERARREKNLDKTLADSFPASDPLSSIPDPEGET
jgi:hypothetical protein